MNKSLETVPVSNWMHNSERPVIISGPCSAESEAQVLSTARALAASGRVSVLRAGIWKPRTRPNSFEGVGEPGLAWLVKARAETGLPITTEVAKASHVEACLKHGVDVLWIGARTTVNPFSVQEIADALRGVDIPVMVKNPINPDVALWIGAIERLHQAGISKLATIHRGFSSYQKTPFRNEPKWELAIEMKRQLPELDMFCDPSHIAGNRDLLGMIAQKALDLDMTGLMLESHIQPEVALSDKDQQVTPAGLVEILDDLTVRIATSDSVTFRTQLDQLRSQIDELDENILQSLSARMKVAEKIGQYKAENNVTVLQVKRWEEIMQHRLGIGTAMGLSEEFISRFLQLVHKESISKQTAIMNAEKTRR